MPAAAPSGETEETISDPKMQGHRGATLSTAVSQPKAAPKPATRSKQAVKPAQPVLVLDDSPPELCLGAGESPAQSTAAANARTTLLPALDASARLMQHCVDEDAAVQHCSHTPPLVVLPSKALASRVESRGKPFEGFGALDAPSMQQEQPIEALEKSSSSPQQEHGPFEFSSPLGNTPLNKAEGDSPGSVYASPASNLAEGEGPERLMQAGQQQQNEKALQEDIIARSFEGHSPHVTKGPAQEPYGRGSLGDVHQSAQWQPSGMKPDDLASLGEGKADAGISAATQEVPEAQTYDEYGPFDAGPEYSDGWGYAGKAPKRFSAVLLREATSANMALQDVKVASSSEDIGGSLLVKLLLFTGKVLTVVLLSALALPISVSLVLLTAKPDNHILFQSSHVR